MAVTVPALYSAAPWLQRSGTWDGSKLPAECWLDEGGRSWQLQVTKTFLHVAPQSTSTGLSTSRSAPGNLGDERSWTLDETFAPRSPPCCEERLEFRSEQSAPSVPSEPSEPSQSPLRRSQSTPKGARFFQVLDSDTEGSTCEGMGHSDSGEEEVELPATAATSAAAQVSESQTPTSKTAKRNQRRRQQAKAAKQLELRDGLAEVSNAKSPKEVEAEIEDVDSQPCQAEDPEASSSPSKAKKKKKKARQSQAKEDPAQPEEAKAAAPKAKKEPLALEQPLESANSVKAAPSKAARGAYRGVRLNRTQRVQLWSQVLELMREPSGSSSSSSSSAKPAPKRVGSLSVSQLAAFGATSDRRLVSVHGRIFDVTPVGADYQRGGSYEAYAGKDITWCLLSGVHDASQSNHFFDVFKADSMDSIIARLRILALWTSRYERNCGPPVGRLDAFEDEMSLPAPSDDAAAECCLM